MSGKSRSDLTQPQSEKPTRKCRLRIGGMTCISCQNKIQKKLLATAGIKSVKVSYSAGTADIVHDDRITIREISAIIRGLDYTVLQDSKKQAPDTQRIIGLLVTIAALYMLLQHFGILNLLAPSQLADTGMGYGMLFVIGLLTSVHCAAMCGGINLSQSLAQSGAAGEGAAPASTFRPTLLYNLGRVISYTAVGFIAGALGSAVTFSTVTQGVLKLIAGVFMVIMGLNMLGIFPWLRRLSPRLPSFLTRGIDKRKSQSSSPLFVGLLNGLMPCGPLQAMQIYALSTGSPFAGAFSMLLFSLGTVPLMFGLGALSAAIGKKFTHKVMTAGAVLVVVLGLAMLSQGFSLSGSPFSRLLPPVSQPGVSSGVQIEDGVQVVRSTLSPGGYPSITVEAGMPVKWIIDAPKGSINGCNNRMFIPEYGIEYRFVSGENVIEFTPARSGRFPYSCWMGMIRSSISVVEAGAQSSPSS